MSGRNAENVLNGLLGRLSYRNSDLTKRDVLNLIRQYKALTPIQEVFVFNDGRQRDLINLYGTIPVPYKGNNYNIPVSVWLLDTHPYHAPICFVKPTQDMQIKVSKHVDSSGKIYLPYLAEWNYPTSDLLGLIQMCIIIFSEMPPVYSRRSEQQPPPQQAAQGLPYPTGNQPGFPGYPAYPPNQPNFQPYPNYPPSASGYPPPAPPGYPPTANNSGYPPYQARPTPGYPGASSGYPPVSNSANSGYPPVNNAEYPSFASQASTESTGSIGQEHIKASILSAVEEKVRRRVFEEFSTLRAERASLNKVNDDLTNGRSRLTQMIQKLEDESTQIDNSIQSLETNSTELETMLAQLEDQNENEICVDDAVIVQTPLYRQLLSAFAEECATEDAIYFLGDALNKGAVDFDTFLKQVRNLSRKQFLLRATMQMCRQKAGLPL